MEGPSVRIQQTQRALGSGVDNTPSDDAHAHFPPPCPSVNPIGSPTRRILGEETGTKGKRSPGQNWVVGVHTLLVPFRSTQVSMKTLPNGAYPHALHNHVGFIRLDALSGDFDFSGFTVEVNSCEDSENRIASPFTMVSPPHSPIGSDWVHVI